MAPDFVAGDVFYTLTDQQYHLFKVVAVDSDLSCYHVASYVPQATLPEVIALPSLPIQIGHSPISTDGFGAPVWLANQPLTARETAGYHAFLQLTQPADAIVEQAIGYFNEGLAHSDAQQHSAAIDAYTKAHDLIPAFFEAVDNRAFCKMDQGRWLDAIADFEESLRINPDSALAEFSIGECYFNLKDYAQAKARFEQALALDPAYDLPREFLAKVAARTGA